jgi:thermitase
VIVENGAGDSDGPVITISSPVDGATVSGNVQVSAFATDDGGVQQITISAGGKMLCAGAPSVSCGWNTRKLAAGNYSVITKALDRSGNASSKSIGVFIAKSTKGGSGNGNDRGRGKKP